MLREVRPLFESPDESDQPWKRSSSPVAKAVVDQGLDDDVKTPACPGQPGELDLSTIPLVASGLRLEAVWINERTNVLNELDWNVAEATMGTSRRDDSS